ncbi:hypothetical protein [Aeromicrobium wangtongii]|uniref:DNA-directed RNA polymerase subunit beta n=1 Tax=Aeromicrobium wangtongii TaxID=2969247 RepID=A0ABY5M259_9ACTN|nr:hypothetical protein [Aeromicrobium wangtongii]MCD9198255.1 hypothetical protein [Aeromicrobium wangtongii]MCL3819033.1 hypothetical protein [Aeromicrobium wangtongii]UUP12290.1 hypothetical protein NQV15_10520 [Aeromicrobium wangtongii]
MSEFKKPSLPGAALFEAQAGGEDPAELAAAGHRIATLMVRGPRTDDDQGLVDRVLHLADEEGLGVIAALWSHAPSDSLPGALWRLYLLRTWVHRQPEVAAREYAAGKAYAPVHEVLAGVVDPPGPEEVIALVDTVVRGIVGADLDVALDRAASFAHICGVGRAQLDHGDPHSAAKLVDTALNLRRAAELERSSQLQ